MNYRSTLVSLTPHLPGVSAEVVDDGLHVIVSNDTSTPLVIFGYAGEPYLRVDSAGSWDNARSPAVYLNKGFVPGAVPAVADAAAHPRWQRISSGDSVIWHDHRLHWMGTSPPAQVQADPHQVNLISDWQISGWYGRRPVTLDGTLSWVPGPSPAGWLAVAGLIATVTAAVLAWSRRRFCLPAVIAALVAADMTASAGLVDGRGGPLAMRLQALPWHGAAQLAVWVVALAAAARAARRPLLATYVAVFTGAAVLLLGTTVGLAATWQSQVIAWHPWWAERALIAATAGLAAGVVLGGLLLHRISRQQLASLAAASLVVVTSACGGSASAARPAAPVVVHASSVGSLVPALTDAHGYVLYIFAPDNHRAVTCQQICAWTWPPVMLGAGQRVVAGSGLHQRLLSTDTDSSGCRVVTYDGWPLYNYVGDVAPGLLNGQAINLNGGLWYAISPTGTVIKRRAR
jgi:predicted lipoprotein with Yx(FWY)xxD motif